MVETIEYHQFLNVDIRAGTVIEATVNTSLQKSSIKTSRALEHRKPKKSPVNQIELKKRLQFLKELRDQKLINEGEYELKRKVLLDQFL